MWIERKERLAARAYIQYMVSIKLDLSNEGKNQKKQYS